MAKLTNRQVEALIAKAKAGQKVAEFTPDGDGLYLRVRSSGAASYWLRQSGYAPYKIANAADGLANARDAAVLTRAARIKGEDPAAARKAAREAVKAKKAAAKAAEVAPDDTLGAVFARYEKAKLRHLKSGAKTAASFRREVPKKWLAMPIGKITRAMIADLVHRVAETKPCMGAMLLSHIGALFGWAVGMGLLDINPAQKIPKPKTNGARERVLDDRELVLVWRAADVLNYRDAAHVRLLILTGQRKMEIGEGRWREIDLDAGMWTIPASRMKNKRAHVFPLTLPVLDILRALPRYSHDDRIFVGPKGGFSVGGSDAKDLLDEEITRLNGGKAIEPWTLHDLRRSAATGMADLKVPPHVIECVLSHVGGFRGGVSGVYKRSNYWDEMKAALALWSAHITDITGPNVIDLKSKILRAR